MEQKELLLKILEETIIIKVQHNGGHIDSAEVVNLEKIVDRLIDNGVFVLPCKVGDMVWGIREYHGVKKPQEGKVSEMYFLPDMTLHVVVKHICRGEFGKNVFFTKEGAEAEIRRRKR